MEKKRQDIIFACLTKSERTEYRGKYATKAKSINYDNGFNDALESVFGIHNLTSDTEPEEMLMVERKKVHELYSRFDKYLQESHLEKDADFYKGEQNALVLLFGDKCLPDKKDVDCDKLNQMLDEALEKETPESLNEWMDSREHPSVQGEPKFKVGDKVRLNFEQYKDGEYDTIDTIIKSDYGIYLYHLKNDDESYAERYLEPYTEPETKLFRVGDKVRAKDTKQIGIIKEPYSNDIGYRVYFEDGDGGWDKEYSADELEPYVEKSTNNQLKANMGEKALNLAKLLKGCDETAFYSPTFSVVLLKAINEDDNKPLFWDFGVMTSYTYADGRIYSNSVPTIFPSRSLYEKYPLDAKKAWDEWASERKPWSPVLGDEYFSVSGCAKVIKLKFLDNAIDAELERVHNRFRTEEEAQQAAEAVRETLDKFHESISQSK